MNQHETQQFSRRHMVMAGLGTAALGAVALAQSHGGSPASDSQRMNQGVKPTDPSPQNTTVRDQNPDSWTPPSTDAGDVNTFKYPFAVAHNRVTPGGWGRQVTVRDLPISKTIAGVNMRLEPGGIRELHWHVPAEWGFMITGSARITAVDTSGRAFVDDVSKGDIFNFPGGIPHSIQGLENGCEFLLVFDDGAFSEFDTFLLTDWLNHTPRQVLSQNLSLSQATFDTLPKKDLWIFANNVPGSLAEDKKGAIGPQGPTPISYSFRLMEQSPDKENRGGDVRIADSTRFKAASTIASALVTLKPGGLRELHWHPNADEWQYFVTGKGRQTVFTGGGKARTMDMLGGDVGYVLQSLPHYIENTGDSDLIFLEMFKSPIYQDISMAEWLSHLPPNLVQAHLGFDKQVIESIPKEERVIVPA
jgi:oxalate decarboxylase